ncbi:MAG: hypothetical protein COV67_05135 [Nitrospinae bacterium CG11_big_fil_rev_8_21_14_0_20_56_8]|nr:MAG: hypothetical protein COV67_05135 [Nitrospinae bacterium CG11_big_fil_rev_8_21_14_0_20_56_8]
MKQLNKIEKAFRDGFQFAREFRTSVDPVDVYLMSPDYTEEECQAFLDGVSASRSRLGGRVSPAK